MFVATGIGPYSGQAVHFNKYAPEPIEYAINRYDFEAWRHWNILNEHLATRRYMVGNKYSIVDIAVWGWARVIPFVQKRSRLSMCSRPKSMTTRARISSRKTNA